jgi:hypothetical protein
MNRPTVYPTSPAVSLLPRSVLEKFVPAYPIAPFLNSGCTRSQGWTALHKAALLHRVDEAICLIDLGADIHLRTNVSHGQWAAPPACLAHSLEPRPLSRALGFVLGVPRTVCLRWMSPLFHIH